MRLARVFETPKNAAEGFIEALADSCDGFSAEVYDRSFVKLRDTREYRTLPMPAQAKAMCEDQREVIEALARGPKRQEQSSVNGDWSPDAAFEFVRRADIAKEAARDGWIGPLVGHVRQFHRAPAFTEIAGLKKIQAEFEDALMIAAGQWRELGAAMAARQARWAEAVLSSQPTRDAA